MPINDTKYKNLSTNELLIEKLRDTHSLTNHLHQFGKEYDQRFTNRNMMNWASWDQIVSNQKAYVTSWLNLVHLKFYQVPKVGAFFQTVANHMWGNNEADKYHRFVANKLTRLHQHLWDILIVGQTIPEVQKGQRAYIMPIDFTIEDQTALFDEITNRWQTASKNDDPIYLKVIPNQDAQTKSYLVMIIRPYESQYYNTFSKGSVIYRLVNQALKAQGIGHQLTMTHCIEIIRS